MNKIVFKGMPKEISNANIAVIYCGRFEKKAVIVNKSNDYRLDIYQGPHPLGAIEGKGRVKLKSYPDITKAKSYKGYNDIFVFATKKPLDTFYSAKICAKVTGLEDVKNAGVSGALIIESFFDTIGVYSFVTIFKPTAGEPYTISSRFNQIKKRGGAPVRNLTTLNGANMKSLIELFVNEFLRNNAMDYLHLDDDSSLQIEEIGKVSNKCVIHFLKALESYVESEFESEINIIGKCTIVGVKDNLLAYI